jgi:hypothetical protein
MEDVQSSKALVICLPMQKDLWPLRPPCPILDLSLILGRCTAAQQFIRVVWAFLRSLKLIKKCGDACPFKMAAHILPQLGSQGPDRMTEKTATTNMPQEARQRVRGLPLPFSSFTAALCCTSLTLLLVMMPTKATLICGPSRKKWHKKLSL